MVCGCDKTQILYWPNEKRNRNDFGRPGKLHAKCAVVDNIGIVGSANLTDDAFNRNMELGVLLREEGLVQELISHFSELYQSGVLKDINLRTL
ncbi:phospholipase D-like domain-containing protein [Chloroflexota bacterium]